MSLKEKLKSNEKVWRIDTGVQPADDGFMQLFQRRKKEVKEEGFLYIRTNAGFDEVMDSLSDKLNQPEVFKNMQFQRIILQKSKPENTNSRPTIPTKNS